VNEPGWKSAGITPPSGPIPVTGDVVAVGLVEAVETRLEVVD
jgi:hypothetical protein